MPSDPIERLYAAAAALEPGDELVGRVIATTSRTPSRPAHGRRLALALVAAVTLVLAATAFATGGLGVVQLGDPAHELVEPTPSAPPGLPVVVTAPEATGLYCEAPGREVEAGATGGDPVAICAALWRTGVVSGTAQQPPALQACVNQSGAIAVYPGTDACAANGRPTAAPYSPPDRKAITLSTRLRAWAAGLPNGCAGSVAQASAEVNALVGELGMQDDGWRIGTSSPGSPSHASRESCIIPTVFEATRIVYLG